MNIQQLINNELSKYIDMHGKMIFVNPLGNKVTLYGYIREVKDDYIIWQDNEHPDRFVIHNVKSFKPITLGEKEPKDQKEQND